MMDRFRRTPPWTVKLYALFFILCGARADDSQRVCVNELIKLDCPELDSVIQSKYYKELYWKVSHTSDESKKQNIGYCNKSLVCTRYDDIGSFDERIKIRNPVRGTLFVKQLILDDQLTYTCHIELRKENKAQVVNKVNVSSSKRCLSATAGQTLDLSQPFRGTFSKETVEDIYWYRILQNGSTAKMAYCSPSLSACMLENCTSSCPEYLTRLKTDGLSIMLTSIKQDDLGLEFQCIMHATTNQRKTAILKPQVYTVRINEIFPPQVVTEDYPNETTATSASSTTAFSRVNTGSYSVKTFWLLAFSIAISLVIAPYGIS